MSSNNNSNPSQPIGLSDLPDELLQLIIDFIEEPSDYLHFAATTRGLWAQMEHQTIILDALRHRDSINRVRPFDRINHNRQNPYRSILEFSMRTLSSLDQIRRMLDIYINVFPEYIRGSILLGLLPLYHAAIVADDLGTFRMLVSKGLASPLAEKGRAYLDQAVQQARGTNIVLWLLEEGVVLEWEHVDTLIARGLVTKGDDAYDRLEKYILNNMSRRD